MTIGRIPGTTGIQPTIVTAKGDLIVATASGSVTNQTVGSNNQVLTADSAQTDGIKWANGSAATLTTTGDILYASSANTPARLGIGSTNQVLTVSGGLPTWSTLSSTTFPAFRAYGQNQQGFSANTWTKVTYDVEDFDTDNKYSSNRFTPGVAGYYYVSARMQAANSGSASCFVAIYKNGVNNLQDSTESNPYASGNPNGIIYLSATDYIEVYANINYSGGNSNGNNILYFMAVGIRS